MKLHPSWALSLVLSSAGVAALWCVGDQWTGDGAALAVDQVAASGTDNDIGNGERSATRSSPIAITSDNKFVWSVNPDNDSVSVFYVAKDKNKKVGEIKVGKEPWCVAIAPGRHEHDSRTTNPGDDA